MSARVERHGDVVRLAMISAGGRAIGLGVSTYVVGGIMIDTGFPRGERDVLRAVRELGVRGAIVTHWHEDHAGNVDALAAHGLPILMRDETKRIVSDVARVQMYRRVVWGQPRTLSSTPKTFELGELEAIHTPGHSPDHQIVWDARTRTVFAGDLWLGVRARVMHPAEEPYAIVESSRRVLALEPARMFDAHRGLVADPANALRLKIAWMEETIGEIERRIIRGESDREIVAQVLGGEELASYVSFGEYSRENFVKAVRRRTR